LYFPFSSRWTSRSNPTFDLVISPTAPIDALTGIYSLIASKATSATSMLFCISFSSARIRSVALASGLAASSCAVATSWSIWAKARTKASWGVVLVALTGYGQDSDRQTSLQAGFNHHLVKPARLEQWQSILATVSELVA
jgi:hypothetical protein